MTGINPYESPREIVTVAPETARLVRNIRAICILYLMFGVFAVLGSIGMLVDPKGTGAPPGVGWIVLAVGLAEIVSAVGVLRKRAWGVPACQMISVLYLLSFPVGTLLGGYFLWNIGEVKDEFC